MLFLAGCTKGDDRVSNVLETWEESPALVKEITVTDDGQTDEFVFRIGNNGKLGFGEYGPFKAGESQKYMWHFWGDKATLLQPFKVIGVKEEKHEEVTVFQLPKSNSLAPNAGADHHLPSTMSLPSKGMWKLMVYFGDELFGEVYVEVE
ncbi:hypothetical protein FGG79_03630 [Bacillus sp. BHET2]|nr:hypothetical protein FGG79_03630 [Bacillus sp. BHET2]